VPRPPHEVSVARQVVAPDIAAAWLDGNHRVSVARYHGVERIDAVVTEFRPCVAASGGDITANHQEYEARDLVSPRAEELWGG